MAISAPTRNLVLRLVLVLHASMDWLVKVAGSNVTAAECLVGAQNLAFDFEDFERYPIFFREESTMTLAQAGVYKGPKNIEEYTRFPYPSSPYLATRVLSGPSINALKAIEGDVCIFSSFSIARYTGDEMMALKGPPSDAPVLVHYYYDPSENYIKKINVYYEVGFLDFYFDKFLNTPQTRDFVCNVMDNVCGFDKDTASGDCPERLEALPTLTNSSYVDGNSQGCRALHAVFADTNPTNHCPHLSFDPTPDPFGNVKCQKSKIMDPLDMFDQDAIAEFQVFSTENGIDPAVGYLLVEEEEEEVQEGTGKKENYTITESIDDAKAPLSSSASCAKSHCIMQSSAAFAAFASAVILSF